MRARLQTLLTYHTASNTALRDTSANLTGPFTIGNIVPMSNGDEYMLSLFDDDVFGDFDWYGEMTYTS